jgi:hypothetical protein
MKIIAFSAQKKKAPLIAATIMTAFFSEYCYSIYDIFILALFGEKINGTNDQFLRRKS